MARWSSPLKLERVGAACRTLTVPCTVAILIGRRVKFNFPRVPDLR